MLEELLPAERFPRRVEIAVDGQIPLPVEVVLHFRFFVGRTDGFVRQRQPHAGQGARFEERREKQEVASQAKEFLFVADVEKMAAVLRALDRAGSHVHQRPSGEIEAEAIVVEPRWFARGVDLLPAERVGIERRAPLRLIARFQVGDRRARVHVAGDQRAILLEEILKLVRDATEVLGENATRTQAGQ